MCYRGLNFSRRVIDHRMPFDYNYPTNKTGLSSLWNADYRQGLYHNIFNNGPIQYMLKFSLFSFSLGIIFIEYTRSLDKKYISKNLTNNIDLEGVNFIDYDGNRMENLGRWNHNYGCWENETSKQLDFE